MFIVNIYYKLIFIQTKIKKKNILKILNIYNFYYNVWLFGKVFSILDVINFFILKCWILPLPWRSINPVTGICEVPVANKSNFVRFSLLNSLTHYFVYMIYLFIFSIFIIYINIYLELKLKLLSKNEQ